MSTKTVKIAAMACCYNRIKKTEAFLNTLTTQYVPDGYQMDIFMLDDQSPDGTGMLIRENYPQVNLIEGSGSLFWAGGMRMLWTHVAKVAQYDFYLLLNDDVRLFDNAIADLISAYKKAPNKDSIIIGSVLNPDHTKITYGGRRLIGKYNTDGILLKPDDAELQECDLGNANIMMVDSGTFDKIGVLSDRYMHSFADFDYTLNAKRHGSKVWVAPKYLGSCDYDHGKPWSSSKSLKKRIEYMRSPKGLESRSYLRYIRKFFPYYYPEAFLKIWLKTLIPSVYDKYKKD